MLLIQTTSIEGFSYAFTENLLKKLKELKADDRIFKSTGALTDIANSVLTHLSNQLNVDISGYQQEIDSGIETAEEFLAIFQKK